jgi:hypothetical protein
MRPSPLRSASLAALLSLFAGAARAETAEGLLRAADPGTARAVLASTDARAALQSLVSRPSRVPSEVLPRILANPEFTPFAVNTLRDLAAIKDVVGIERVVQRITHNDRRLIAGAAFEINVAARYGQDLAEISPTIQVTDLATGLPKQVEVDARLRDGTLVEVKYDSGGWSDKLAQKGIEQLILRQASRPGGVPVALVTNFQLSQGHLERARAHRIPVFRASPSGGGLVRQPEAPAARAPYSTTPTHGYGYSTRGYSTHVN